MKYVLFFAFSCMTAMAGFGQQLQKIRACVIAGGELKELDVDYNPATGERSILVNGVRKEFYSVYPKKGAGYAEGESWFVNNEAVAFKSRSYVKYGLPRILGVNEITKTGTYKGVNVYIEAGYTGLAEVIYLPVRQGCEFQPYQLHCGDATIEKIATTGKTMQVKAIVTGLKGKISYQWSSQSGKIVKGQGTAQATIDFSGKKDNANLDVRVVAKDAQNCPVHQSAYYEVEN